MGNNKGKADQGRFSSGSPKKPKPPKCRECKTRILLDEDDWHRIGGKRYHKECRT